MSDLYRVFPWVEGAARGRPGHPLFVPVQGFGRVDNPERYGVLYLADKPEAAIAEALGPFPVWDTRLLEGMATLPRSVLALGTFTGPRAPVLDLDAPEPLAERDLIPSTVATRDRTRTRAWALRVYEENRWSGVRWWGYYEASWGSFGLWRTTGLRVRSVARLTIDHPDLVEAARTLGRPIRR